MEPTRLYAIVAILSLVTVEYGGWALLGFVLGPQRLGPFRERFFRAGHAHAGVLLVLSLVYLLYLPAAEYSEGVEWLVGAVLLTGALAQSSGFFLHLGLGKEDGGASPGTLLTRAGALLLAAALIVLAVGLIRTA